VQSWRRYLAGASFLVGLEARAPGRDGLLRQVDAALARPVWQVYLGRKGYVPGLPVRLPEGPPLGPGLRDEPLELALRAYPWPAKGAETLRFVFETDDAGEGEARMDAPVSFAPLDRRYQARYVRTEFFGRGDAPVADEFGELEQVGG